jgi:hypothetical protein
MLKPVRLHKFTDDYGTGWTAVSVRKEPTGVHLIGGHSTMREVIAMVDESSFFRFDDIEILARRFGKLYRPCTFDRIDRHLDYGESISFESETLKGWIARLESDRLSVLVHWHTNWLNHAHRDNLPLFWQEHCSVNLPLPQTEAEYLELVAQVEAKT